MNYSPDVTISHTKICPYCDCKRRNSVPENKSPVPYLNIDRNYLLDNIIVTRWCPVCGWSEQEIIE